MAKDSVSGKTSVFTFGKDAVSVETSGKISYYRTDENHSVSEILNSEGKTEATLTYDEYGRLENPDKVRTAGNIFTYTGHVYEESTGLYYAKARYYDAETGRFLARDSYQGNVKEPATLNPYSYARQNPFRYIDPSGHILVQTIAKFGVGALFDMGMQIVANYFFNSKTAGNFKASFDKINWWQVTVSGAQNLFTFKSKYLTAAITGFGDVIVNWMKQGKKYSCTKALRDFAFGFASDLAARYVCKFGAKAVAKGLDKLGVNPAKIKKLTGIDLAGSKTSGNSRKVHSKGVGNPVKIVGRGSTGRKVPHNLNEQMAMHQVQSNPLKNAVDMSKLSKRPIIMTDSRWPASQGWVKMSNNVNGIEIHFVYNKKTGEFDDFKFK